MSNRTGGSGRTAASGTRGGGVAAARLAGALLLATPLAALAQECRVDDGPTHAAWHARELALRTFEDSLKAMLVDAGVSPVGGVTVARGPTGSLEIEPRMLSVPPGAGRRFDASVERLVAASALEPGEALTLDLGQPRPDLDPDRTERCEAVLDNVAEMSGLVAQVVAGAIARENKARPARIRIDLWTRVEWTGRVGAMELRDDGGQWGWLVPYLQALAPAMRYRPATLNGVPRTTWMSQMFELEF